MMYLAKEIAQDVRTFWRDDSANATVEFVLVAPMLFWLVFSVFEAGWLMTRQMMLERGLDLMVRDLRLGLYGANPSHDTLKANVCNYAKVFKDCQNSVHLELAVLDRTTLGLANTSEIGCVDRTGAVSPVVNVNPGARSDIMFVRACMVVDPLLPGTGLGAQLTKDPSGGFAMVAYGAFMNEPP